MNIKASLSVAIIVAHPDDETLWAGGLILNNPQWNCFIISLCRKSDEDRCSKFFKVLKILNADGTMGDLDDEPEQKPIKIDVIKQIILELLPKHNFDIIITHNPKGEYTKHLRHDEVSEAVIMLWNESKINTTELWTFAYEDGGKNYYPKAIENASFCESLSLEVWLKKYKLITEIYGFDLNSWEAKSTPKSEAFWIFNKTKGAIKFLNK
jgi:LmbE family N-acetylglucosaminyl deacetylase